MNRQTTMRRRVPPLVAALMVVVLGTGCGGALAYRGGQKFSEKGDWDLAVARFTRALEAAPQNIKYKIALENAKIQASRFHTDKARKHVQTGNFEKAMEEYGIAAGYDPSNKAATDDIVVLKARVARMEAEKELARDLAKRRPGDAVLPVPLLSPRSQNEVSIRMTAPFEQVYRTLGTMAGVNVVFDPDMQQQGKVITANVSGVTFQEALDQIGLVNKKAYRVLDRNTILIVDDNNPQQRQRWDDQVMRTFYLENIEAKDLEPVLRQALGTTAKVTKNDATNAITVISTLDEMALADRFIRSNDKAKGEILVEVEILEINRTKAKEYGLQLSNYQAAVELQPTGVAGEVSGGLTQLRAHLLSSLNASDWIVQIPSSLFSRFLHDESIVKIISSPKVRAFEGKKATFKVGTDVPIPQFYPGYGGVTQPGQTAGGFAGGSTSATYKTVGVNLEIDKAKVTGSDEITMEFKAEFSLIGEDKVFGTGANQVNYPQFLTREIVNTLRLSDGVTAVIGGLLQGREARSLKGALGLESIPILNRILGGQNRRDEEIEILISLTPHILRAPNILPEDIEPMYLGLRNNLRIPGVRPLFGPEVATPAVPATASPTPPPVSTQTPPGPGPSGAPRATPTPAPTPAPAPIAPQPSPTPRLGVDSPPARVLDGATPPTPPAAPNVGPRAARSAWDRTEITMKVGQVERVAVNLFDLQSVTDLALAVRSDSTAIEFVEVDPGQLLSVDGVQVLTERQLDAGRASARFRRATPLSGGTGKVATIGFRALRAGEVTIFVENLTLGSGSASSGVALAGAVRVTVTP